MARFDTVTTIITDVAVEVGLGVPTGSVTSATGDPNIYRMFKLLKSTGRRLVKKYPWIQQLVQYTLTTTSDTIYNLPSDFETMVDQTGWNRTSRFHMDVAGPQEWQYLKALPVTSYLSVIFRPGYSVMVGVDDTTADIPTIELLSSPGSGQTLAFEYRSRYWVRSGAMPHALQEAPVTADDRILIDAGLIAAALKLAWLRELGFDSTAAQQDLEGELEAARTTNVGAAPILSIGASRNEVEPLISESNAGRGGFGFDAGGLF